MGKKKLSKKDELILELQEEIAELKEMNDALILSNILDMVHCDEGKIRENSKVTLPEIESVIYDNPKVIICWSDQTTTMSKCMPEDTYSKEFGYFICVCKKMLGENKFRELLKKHLKFME